jgi:hypothetical protein
MLEEEVLLEVTDRSDDQEDVRLFIGELLTEGDDVYKPDAVDNLLDSLDNEVGVFECDDDDDADEELDAEALRVILGLFDPLVVRSAVFVFIDETVLSLERVPLVENVLIAVLVDEAEVDEEYEDLLVVEYVTRGVIDSVFNEEPVSNIEELWVNEIKSDCVPQKSVTVSVCEMVLTVVFELVAERQAEFETDDVTRVDIDILGDEEEDNEAVIVESMVVEGIEDAVIAVVVDPDAVVEIVAEGDNEKAAEALADFVSDGDDDGDDVGEVDADRLNWEDEEGIEVPVAVTDTEKNAETVAVDVNKGVALNVPCKVIDNKADCDVFSEVKGVALVVIEFVSTLVRDWVDIMLFKGALVRVKLLVGETLDDILDEPHTEFVIKEVNVGEEEKFGDSVENNETVALTHSDTKVLLEIWGETESLVVLVNDTVVFELWV